jgi:hypothetical protein
MWQGIKSPEGFMNKLPLIWLGGLAVVASIAVGQGCGNSTTNTGGSGPGGSNAGGMTPQGGGGSTNSTTPSTGGSTATSQTSNGGGNPGTGGTSPGTGGAGGGSSACSGSTPVALTIFNPADWCNVSINGMTATTAGSQTVCVAATSTAKLTAAPIPGFTLSDTMWHHVDDSTGDTGVKGDQATTPGKSLETKTVGATGTACAWVCCPGTGDPTECDVGGAFVPTDPCQ